MNNQVIVPVAVIILIAIIMAIAFFNWRDKKELEEQLKRNFPKKKISDTNEGEK
jgi:predicted PurR-regulated permease PerM